MARIHVVGLGPGDMTGLPMGTYRQLQSGLPIYLRTRIHPVVDELLAQGVTFQSFDDLYESGERFETIYRDMAEHLLSAAAGGELVYAVPGHPLMAEQSVQHLIHMAPEHGVEVVIGPGQSFLDAVCTTLHLDPIQGMLLLDGTAMSADRLQPSVHTLIVQVFSRAVASEVKLTLMEVYGDDHAVTVVRAAGVAGQEQIACVPLHELDHLDWIDHLTTVYVPPAGEQAKRRDPWFVTELVRKLRAPDGCPWDRKQTHLTLRPYVIEEAYEVAGAIDEGDPFALADELGDLFLQVLLHAQIASELGSFTVRDVYESLADKLIRRHPHVFGDQRADDAAAAQASWDAAKAGESNGMEDDDSAVAGVKWARPPHKVAVDLQARAAEVGFDWGHIHGVMDKLREEVAELDRELLGVNPEASREELGDVLFTITNVCRWLNVDMEALLQEANRKFANRFRDMERLIREKGGKMGEISLEELEKCWVEAKMARKYTNMSDH